MLRLPSIQSDKTKFLLVIFIIAIVVVSYFPSLHADFVNWDDGTHLYENPHVKKLNFKNLKLMFTTSVNKIYIPLTTLTFAVEYFFVKDNPFLYHLNNLILHIVVTVLLFFMARKLGLNNVGASMAALIFGIHPIHVESVAWVTERKDVLYAALYMASTLCYMFYVDTTQEENTATRKTSIYYFVAAVVLGILSMLAKPMALSLPLIFFLIDWFYKRPINMRLFFEKIPIGLVLVGIAWVTYTAHAREFETSFFNAILIWIWTFSFYIKQFFMPLISVPLYSLPKPVSLFNFEYTLALIIFGLSVWSVIKFKKNQWLVFALFYYLLSIFFLLRFDDVADTNIVADRWMYLPCLGFCILLGFVAQRLLCMDDSAKRNLKNLAAVSFVLLICLFSYKTFTLSKVWKNSITLWQHQLYYYPHEPIALNNLATFLRDKEEFIEAEARYKKYLELKSQGVKTTEFAWNIPMFQRIYHIRNLYRKAIQYDPVYTDAYYNLGNFYRDIGLTRKAIIYYSKAVSLDPGYTDAHFNLGRIYLETNNVKLAEEMFNHLIELTDYDQDMLKSIIKAYNDALKETGGTNEFIRLALSRVFDSFTKTISDNRHDADAFFELGSIYQETGNKRKAQEAYLMALEINPKQVDSLYNLANIYEEVGDINQALSLYQRVLRIDPGYELAYMNLGVVYSQLKNFEEAKKAFKKAVKLKPDNADAHFNLGYIYEVTGQSMEALDQYDETIKVDSKHAEAYYNKGNVYAKLGNNKRAIEAYLGAINSKPNHINALVNLSIFYYKEQDFANAIKYCDEARVLGYDAPEKYLAILAPYRNK